MPKAKLTQRVIERIAPKSRDFFVWDMHLKGFGLKVTPAGRKVYVADYSLPQNGRTARATIGTHGSPWTLKEARDCARKIIFEAKSGIDHNAEKRRQRSQAVDLAFDAYAAFFIDNYLKSHWPGSANRAASSLKCHAIPHFRKIPINLITRQDASQWLDSLKDRPATQRKAREVVSKMMRWAEDRGDIESNPIERIPVNFANPGRDRVLSDQELSAVWEGAVRMGHPYGSMVRMLILSGQRLGEVRGMRWDELDLPRKHWNVPPERTKSGRGNVLPLTTAMVETIQACSRRKEFVFSVTGEKQLGNLSQLFARLRGSILDENGNADADAWAHWTLHDLRRTAASGLQKLGVSPDMIEVVQGRTLKLGAGNRYQRYDYLEERRQILDSWSEHVLGLLPRKRQT